MGIAQLPSPHWSAALPLLPQPSTLHLSLTPELLLLKYTPDQSQRRTIDTHVPQSTPGGTHPQNCVLLSKCWCGDLLACVSQFEDEWQIPTQTRLVQKGSSNIQESS